MFEKLKERFLKGYVRYDQLRRYVALGIIDEKQFKEICGKDY